MDIKVERVLAAPPETTWNIVSDFGGLKKWAPVDACSVEGRGLGSVRTVQGNGMIAKERLTALDPHARTLKYQMIQQPDLPWTDYRARLAVAQTPTGCTVTWECSLTPLAAEEVITPMIERTFQEAFNRLAALVEP